MTTCDSAARHKGGEHPPVISAEARDALYSQAMDLLSGIGARRAEIGPASPETCEDSWRALGQLGVGGLLRRGAPTGRFTTLAFGSLRSAAGGSVSG